MLLLARHESYYSNHSSSQDREFKLDADLSKCHPSWQVEIEENLTSQIIANLKNISKDLGALGILLFIRLFKFHQMSVSDKKHEAKVGKQQMDLNSKYSKGGIPITTSGFLSMVSE